MSLPGPFSLEIMVVHACIPLNIWKCWCYHTSLKNNGWNPKMKVWKMISLFKQVIFGFHVNFPGCISLTHLKKTFCQDSPKIHAFFGRVLIAMKNCHQDQPPLTYHQPCKQASKTAKVSYQDNSTQLTSPYSSFRCSSISACCDLAAKYWSTCVGSRELGSSLIVRQYQWLSQKKNEHVPCKGTIPKRKILFQPLDSQGQAANFGGEVMVGYIPCNWAREDPTASSHLIRKDM